jgi:hypothetical protein
MKKNKRKTLAYKQGFSDAEHGVTNKRNPYAKGSTRWKDYEQGFKDRRGLHHARS